MPARIPSSEAHCQTRWNGDRGEKPKVDRRLLHHFYRESQRVPECGHHADKGPTPRCNGDEIKPTHKVEVRGYAPYAPELTRKHKADQHHGHRGVLPRKRIWLLGWEPAIDDYWG